MIEHDLRRRIELSRVFLITAIVFHHIRMPAELSLFTWDNLGYLRGFVQIGLLKTATSTLTVISGYLLFSSRFELAPTALILKKFKTLFVPMVLWNIPLAFAIFIFQLKGQYLFKYDYLGDGNVLNWVNALVGLTHEPANYPLHFLRNILGCNIIALVLGGTFRRHAAIAFVAILIVGILDLDGPLVTRSDLLIGFFLGGLIAVTAIDYTSVDFLLPIAAPCFLIAAFFMFYLQVDYDLLWWLPHRLLGFLTAWPLIGYITKLDIGDAISKYSKYMFFLFLSHYYSILLLFAIFSQFISLEHFYIYFLAAGPLTICISIAGQRVMSLLFPRLLSVATGGRS